MYFSVGLQDLRTGETIDLTRRVLRNRSPKLDSKAITFEIKCKSDEASQYVDDPRVRLVIASRFGHRYIYRLGQCSLTRIGVRFEGYNLTASLDGIEYSRLWSTSKFEDWKPMKREQISNRAPERFEMDTNNRIQIAPRKGEVMSNGAVGEMMFTMPRDSNTQITAVQIEWECNAPVGYLMRFDSRNGDALTLVQTLGTFLSTGAVVYGAHVVGITSADRLCFSFYWNSGVASTYAGESGAAYARITAIRLINAPLVESVVTTSNNAIPIGVGVTITPASMDNVYEGQRIVLSSSLTAATSEAVTVLSVGATTFTATTTKSHLVGATIRSLVVTDKQIVDDLIDRVKSANPYVGTSSAKLLVQSSGRDVSDATWSLARASSVLADLSKKSGYEWGVNRSGQVFYLPRGTYAMNWQVRFADLELSRSFIDTYSAVQVKYRRPDDEALFTGYMTSLPILVMTGVASQKTVDVDTTLGTDAIQVQATALADQKNTGIQSGVTFKKLYDIYGNEYPPEYVQPGDTISISNLPSLLNAEAYRKFVVAETAVDLATGRPSVVPENPLQLLDVLLANIPDRKVIQDYID